MRHALVTGGAKGIGRAIAERLAGDGYAVTITGRDGGALDETVAASEGRLGAMVLDVTDEAAVQGVFEAAAAERGPVEVLVNNAGVAGSAKAARTTLADWDQHLRTNATGVFLCTRAVLPTMLARDFGRVVTVASVAAHVGLAYTSAYSASKHAALGYTRAVAAELRGTGVTANCVCPAYVRTEMAERAFDTVAAASGRDPDQARQAVLATTGQPRLVEPEEVAEAVAYLASVGAGFVNGQSLVIDGGATQH